MKIRERTPFPTPDRLYKLLILPGAGPELYFRKKWGRRLRIGAQVTMLPSLSPLKGIRDRTSGVLNGEESTGETACRTFYKTNSPFEKRATRLAGASQTDGTVCPTLFTKRTMRRLRSWFFPLRGSHSSTSVFLPGTLLKCRASTRHISKPASARMRHNGIR